MKLTKIETEFAASAKYITTRLTGHGVTTEEKKLEAYVENIKGIPYVSILLGFQNLRDFLASDKWEEYFTISQEIFEENLKIDEFRGQMEALFQEAKEVKEEEWTEILCHYLGKAQI